MAENFNRWHDSPSTHVNSFLISDSDDDITDRVEKQSFFVIESNDSSENCSRSTTPERTASALKKSQVTENAVKESIRQHIHYSNSEDDSFVLEGDESHDLIMQEARHSKYFDLTQTSDSERDEARNSKSRNPLDLTQTSDSEGEETHDVSMPAVRNSKSRKPLDLTQTSDSEGEETHDVSMPAARKSKSRNPLDLTQTSDSEGEETHDVSMQAARKSKSRNPLNLTQTSDSEGEETHDVSMPAARKSKSRKPLDLTQTSDSEGEETHDHSMLEARNSKYRKPLDLTQTSDSEGEESHDLIKPEADYSNFSKHSSDMRREDQPMSLNNSITEAIDVESLNVTMSLAKQEVGVGNIDPMVAQKRALLVFKMEQLQNEVCKLKVIHERGNIHLLPDKGEKLCEVIAMQEAEIEKIAEELENTPLTKRVEPQVSVSDDDVQFVPRDNTEVSHSYKFFDPDPIDLDSIPLRPKLSPESKELGKKAQATMDRELTLTVDRLQDLHGSLIAMPSENERAEDPQGLRIKLMPHQQRALAWLMWREGQRPPGGLLADDMGLGKTLTMISLIIAGIANARQKESNEDSDDEWTDNKDPLRHRGGTLVVCPASLLSQWENEINNRCKRGMLSVQVYHGTNRETVPKRLARNDVVITTYNILSREFKTRATAYKIRWERVILDEAHVIRNHKSQAAEAVCGLVAKKRWALTGTPIQNKELDLYSILKFIKCSPFDDLRVWKRWVDNKNAAGRQRLATVMKSLMLRRTKQDLQAKGDLECLPDKCVEEVLVKLDPQEQLVYEKVLIYSRTLFAQFLSQRADKDHMYDLAAGKYDKPSFLSNPNKNTQFTKAQNRLLSMHADVKTHEILVLLLRLRQVCVHPSLIHSMLDQEDMEESGLMDTENVDSNLLSRMDSITLGDATDGGGDANTSETEIGVDHRVTSNLLTSSNPVFQTERVSSKMQAVLKIVKQILQKGDKLIIVSQWTSMLEIVAAYLPSLEGATFNMFTGKVPIRDRQGIMDDFNTGRNPKILLLSLTAGGVGLNLVGGNHLLLIDIHWNPQLEVQAQDRIYRFGQKKDVYIYKFICKDTIEERIKHLQETKMDIAANVLSGDNNSSASKLTLNDLKSLFAL